MEHNEENIRENMVASLGEREGIFCFGSWSDKDEDN